MEKTEIKEKKKGKVGGARPGAGRPPGSKSHITIEGLLNQVQAQTNGQDYEQLLVQDFLSARYSDDKQLLLKYHNLILNKVMNSLAKIEVTDSADAVEAKKQAFADALAKLAGVSADAK
jgi:hypothetical protein